MSRPTSVSLPDAVQAQPVAVSCGDMHSAVRDCKFEQVSLTSSSSQLWHSKREHLHVWQERLRPTGPWTYHVRSPVQTTCAVCRLFADVCAAVHVCGHECVTGVICRGLVLRSGHDPATNKATCHTPVNYLQRGRDAREFTPLRTLADKEVRAVVCGGQHTCVLTARKWVEDSEVKDCMLCHSGTGPWRWSCFVCPFCRCVTCSPSSLSRIDRRFRVGDTQTPLPQLLRDLLRELLGQEARHPPYRKHRPAACVRQVLRQAARRGPVVLSLRFFIHATQVGMTCKNAFERATGNQRLCIW